MKYRFRSFFVFLLLILTAVFVFAETQYNENMNSQAAFSGSLNTYYVGVNNGSINGTTAQILGSSNNLATYTANFSGNLTGNFNFNVTFWLNLSRSASRDSFRIGLHPPSITGCHQYDGATLFYDSGTSSMVYVTNGAGYAPVFEISNLTFGHLHKFTFEWNTSGSNLFNLYVDDVLNESLMAPRIQSCNIADRTKVAYFKVQTFTEGTANFYYVDDITVYNKTTAVAADLRAAEINQSSYNHAAAYFNGTAWRTAISGYVFTADDTPTIVFNTTEASNATIGTSNLNFTAQYNNDSSLFCSTTDTAQHSCTLPVKYSLNVSHFNTLYLALRDSAGNENATSSSGALRILFNYLPSLNISSPVNNSPYLSSSTSIPIFFNGSDLNSDTLNYTLYASLNINNLTTSILNSSLINQAQGLTRNLSITNYPNGSEVYYFIRVFDNYGAVDCASSCYGINSSIYNVTINITGAGVNISPNIIFYSPGDAFFSSGSCVNYDFYFNDTDSATINYSIIENGVEFGFNVTASNVRNNSAFSKLYPNGTTIQYNFSFTDGPNNFTSLTRNFTINSVTSVEALSLRHNGGKINITGNGTYTASMSWIVGWNMSGIVNDTNYTYRVNLASRFNLSSITGITIRQNTTGNTPNFSSNTSTNITFTSFGLNADSCGSNIYSILFDVSAVNASNFLNQCVDTGFGGSCNVSMNLKDLVNYRLSNLDMVIDQSIIQHWENRRSIDIDYINLSIENKTQASGNIVCADSVFTSYCYSAGGLFPQGSGGNSSGYQDDNFGTTINTSAPSSEFSGSISNEQTTLNPSITADSSGITVRGFSIAGDYNMVISYSWGKPAEGGVGIPAGAPSGVGGGGGTAAINVYEIIGNISVGPKMIDTTFFKIPYVSPEKANISVSVSVVPELCVFEIPDEDLSCIIDPYTKIVTIIYEPTNNTKFSHIEKNRLIIRAKGGQAFVPVQFRLFDFGVIHSLIIMNITLIMLIVLIYYMVIRKK